MPCRFWQRIHMGKRIVAMVGKNVRFDTYGARLLSKLKLLLIEFF
jgi:hypothetical protein